MITLITYAPSFGEPAASPFCTKAIWLLDMSGLAWQREDTADPRKGPILMQGCLIWKRRRHARLSAWPRNTCISRRPRMHQSLQCSAICGRRPAKHCSRRVSQKTRFCVATSTGCMTRWRPSATGPRDFALGLVRFALTLASLAARIAAARGAAAALLDLGPFDLQQLQRDAAGDRHRISQFDDDALTNPDGHARVRAAQGIRLSVVVEIFTPQGPHRHPNRATPLMRPVNALPTRSLR